MISSSSDSSNVISFDELCTRVARNDSTTTLVELFFENIPDESLIRLSQSLSTNDKVTYMLMQGCEAGLGGLRALARMLRTNKSLKYFFVNEDEGVGDAGSTILVDGLMGNNEIIAVSFEQLSISASGAQEISRLLVVKPTIIELSVAQNPLQHGAFAFSHGIKLNKTLEVLSLNDCQVDSAAASALFRAVSSHPAMRRLDVAGNYLNDEVAGELEFMLLVSTNLDFLNLAKNSIGPAGCEAITSSLMCNDVLKALMVSENKFGPKGAEMLQQRLPLMTGVEDICLGRNGYGDEGHRKVVDGLRQNKSIIKANIGSIDDVPPLCYFLVRSYERRNKIAWKILEGRVPNALWPHIFSKLGREAPELINFFLLERPALIAKHR